MDYRYTEEFARRMEMAELRAHALRREAIMQFWDDFGRLLKGLWRAATGRM